MTAFKSDFERYGAEQYSSFHHRSQMRLVDDPAGSGSRVLSMTARAQDWGPTQNPRVQMTVPKFPLTECTEFYASVSVFIPELSVSDANAMSSRNGHVMVAQVYGPPYAGPAPFRIGWNHDPRSGEAVFGVGAVTRDTLDPQTIDLWRVPLVTNRWITVAFRMLMSRDADEGFVQVWSDLGDGDGLKSRELMNGSRTYHYPTLNMSNFDSENPVGSTMFLDSYWPGRIGIDSVTVLFRDNALGNSLDDVRPVAAEQ